jgi:enoyl-CoA hydratase/carnithine racemase
VVLTLNRPECLNALDVPLLTSLHETFDHLAMDSKCRVVILTGAGRGFCSGLDLTAPPVAPHAAGADMPTAGMRTQNYIASLVPKIMHLPQTVISAVNGPAIGGGLALVAACDLRIGSESAVFQAPFIRLGISADDIGMSFTLPRLVGPARAAELLYTGRKFDAHEADRIGFISQVTTDEELLSTAHDLADLLLSHSPFALEMTKQVLQANFNAPDVESAIALENRTQVLAGTTGDFFEAALARQENRKPRWAATPGEA